MVAHVVPVDDGRMPLRVLLVVVVVVLALAPASVGAGKTTEFSQRVSHICAGARLFDGRHAIGTRAGAIAVSRDIRRTGTRRLRRVASVPEPDGQTSTIQRWLQTERLLVEIYARNYLLIWGVIERADTPAQQDRLAVRLEKLVHEPDRLKSLADTYEVSLGVPDCSGGGH